MTKLISVTLHMWHSLEHPTELCLRMSMDKVYSIQIRHMGTEINARLLYTALLLTPNIPFMTDYICYITITNWPLLKFVYLA